MFSFSRLFINGLRIAMLHYPRNCINVMLNQVMKSRANNMLFLRLQSPNPIFLKKNLNYIKRFNTTSQKSSKNLSSRREQLISFAKPAKKELAYGLLLLPLALTSTMAFPYFVGKIVDTLSSDPENIKYQKIKTNATFLASFVLIGAAATFGRNYFINLSTEIIVKDLRHRLFSHLVKSKPLSFFDSAKIQTAKTTKIKSMSSGELLSRLSADSTLISQTLTESLSMGLRGLGTFIFSTGFLFFTSVQLATISVLSISPLVILARLYGQWIKKYTNKQLSLIGDSSSKAEESLNGQNLKIVKLFNRQNFMVNGYEQKLGEVFEVGKRICLYRGGFFGSVELIMNTAMLGVIGYGSNLVFSGVLSPGELATFLLYALSVTSSAFQVSGAYTSVMRMSGAVDRILEVWPDPTKEENLESLPKLGHIKGMPKVEFNDISFSYPGVEEKKILDGLNFVLPAGKSTAILAHSGAGKSSLANILTGLYPLEKGKISINFPDGENFDLQDKKNFPLVREMISVVSQESVIFDGTVKENILFGNLEATDEEIEHVSQLVGLKQQGLDLDKLVGQKGGMLSGGQRQRICIARAMLKQDRAKILILDEATSSLDVENELLVQKSLEQFMPGRTTLVITHRLSAIKNVDYIAILENGKIADFGEREEMLGRAKGLMKDFLDINERNR